MFSEGSGRGIAAVWISKPLLSLKARLAGFLLMAKIPLELDVKVLPIAVDRASEEATEPPICAWVSIHTRKRKDNKKKYFMQTPILYLLYYIIFSET
jgi:hypothetical protein